MAIEILMTTQVSFQIDKDRVRYSWPHLAVGGGTGTMHLAFIYLKRSTDATSYRNPHQIMSSFVFAASPAPFVKATPDLFTKYKIEGQVPGPISGCQIVAASGASKISRRCSPRPLWPPLSISPIGYSTAVQDIYDVVTGKQSRETLRIWGKLTANCVGVWSDDKDELWSIWHFSWGFAWPFKVRRDPRVDPTKTLDTPIKDRNSLAPPANRLHLPRLEDLWLYA